MDDQTIRFLIEQKISFINSALNACMLWWVSSIVFCGTVLAAVWIKRDELQQQRLITGTFIILSIFFLSVTGFGLSAIYFLAVVETEIAFLASSLKTQDDLLLMQLSNFFGTELGAFRVAMWIGAGSFAFVWLSLLYMWRKLFKEASSERQQPVQSEKLLRNGQLVSRKSLASSVSTLFGLWVLHHLLRGTSAEGSVKPKQEQPNRRKNSANKTSGTE